jgi:DNA-binding transcriptional MocR family regulator
MFCHGDPGDTVIVEETTYPRSLHSMKNTAVRFSASRATRGMQVELIPV